MLEDKADHACILENGLYDKQQQIIAANRQLALHRRARKWEARLSEEQRLATAANRSRAIQRREETRRKDHDENKSAKKGEFKDTNNYQKEK